MTLIAVSVAVAIIATSMMASKSGYECRMFFSSGRLIAFQVVKVFLIYAGLLNIIHPEINQLSVSKIDRFIDFLTKYRKRTGLKLIAVPVYVYCIYVVRPIAVLTNQRWFHNSLRGFYIIMLPVIIVVCQA